MTLKSSIASLVNSRLLCATATFILLSVATARAAAFVPNEKTQFFLVTCDPGEEVYSLYGHSGILVRDSAERINDVFHWGIFSYDNPHFLTNFVRGYNYYSIGIYPFDYFVNEYRTRGSGVYGNELVLTLEQKKRLMALLQENYRPENRKFIYNFIYDNCATRPYHIILSAYQHNLNFEINENFTTYRQIIDSYNDPGSLVYEGITIVIGSEADDIINCNDAVGFPFYLQERLVHCTTTDSVGETPILKDTIVFNQPAEKRPNFSFSLTYYLHIIIPLLIALALVIYFIKRHPQHFMPIASHLILAISGLLGLVIYYLWFHSIHPLVKANFNILWLNPLNIVLLIALLIRQKYRLKLVLSAGSALLTFAFLFAILAGAQHTTLPVISLWVLFATNITLIALTYRKAFSSHKHKTSKKTRRK